MGAYDLYDAPKCVAYGGATSPGSPLIAKYDPRLIVPGTRFLPDEFSSREGGHNSTLRL
jgi:hypothetical protein